MPGKSPAANLLDLRDWLNYVDNFQFSTGDWDTLLG